MQPPQEIYIRPKHPYAPVYFVHTLYIPGCGIFTNPMAKITWSTKRHRLAESMTSIRLEIRWNSGDEVTTME